MLAFAHVPTPAAALDSVEVFRTNIAAEAVALGVRRALHQQFAALRISFDLDDCDRILRIESPHAGPELWAQVLAVVRGLGVAIDVLPD